MGVCASSVCTGNAAAAAPLRFRWRKQQSFLDVSRHKHESILTNLVWVHEADLKSKYDIVEELGRGAAGEVYVVQKRKSSVSSSNSVLLGSDAHISSRRQLDAQLESTLATVPSPGTLGRMRRYAMKTFHLDRIDKELLMEFENEIQLLQGLHHPHIISLKEVFMDRKQLSVCLVMDLCRGGNLMDAGIMSEAKTCKIVIQILRALTYLHSYAGICHRDLKMENIVLENEGDPVHVRLIDFGISQKFVGGNEKMREVCGTVYAMAPEVLAGEGYTQKADIWSLGVISCMLLCGETPFLKDERDLKDPQKVERLMAAKFTLHSPLWKESVSPDAKSFIGSLLKRAPGYRPAAKEALTQAENSWKTKLQCRETAGEVSTSPSLGKSGENVAENPEGKCRDSAFILRLTNSMQSFAGYSTVKKVALMVAAFMLDTEEIRVLRDVFLEIDVDRSGLITLDELALALKSQNMTEAEVESLFASIDQDKSNTIHWTEFIAATLESIGEVEEEKLVEAFQRMDVDKTGSISRQDLQHLLGSSHTPDMIAEILREAKVAGDEGISFARFMDLFLKSTVADSI